jgi:DNA-binding transcriptional ArsR family regulator
MKRLRPWVKLPNAWIEANGLRDFRWKHGKGAANEAALIALAVIAHHSDTDTGITRITYNELTDRASLSRAMVSAGLSILDEKKLIIREPEGRSTYALAGFNPNADWAKLPAAPLYQNGAMAAFSEFQKRKSVELDAMKLYFLFASRRSRDMNFALLTYEQIEQRSGVKRHKVKAALSLLCATGMIHIEHLPRGFGEPGIVSGYRLAHLDSYRHMGTTGRGVDPVAQGGGPF